MFPLPLFQYFQRSSKMTDMNRRLKSLIWSSVVTIVLIEGKNLLPMDVDGYSDPYIKFRYILKIWPKICCDIICRYVLQL